VLLGPDVLLIFIVRAEVGRGLAQLREHTCTSQDAFFAEPLTLVALRRLIRTLVQTRSCRTPSWISIDTREL
jgi:hypothetical protein